MSLSAAESEKQLSSIPDLPVINQYGEKLNFYTDLVKGKTVAINFIFTHCKMTCPLLGYQFGQLRKKLGDNAGEKIHLISVSIDPLNDTPQQLKQWSSNFNPGKGWTLVTGTKTEIDSIVKSLQAFAPDIQDHSSMVLMGRESQGDWKRVDGLSSADLLLTALSDWL